MARTSTPKAETAAKDCKKPANPPPAHKIERRRLDALKPFKRNARTHSDKQIDEICASIREWGWTVPILIDEEGMIIAGHGRVAAAQKLGLKDVPVIVASGWTDAQKRAYVLADNQLALNAGWDEELRRIEVSELKELGFDVGLIGFSAHTLSRLLEPADGANASPVLGEDLTYQVIVRARDEAHQTELLDRFEKEGFDCRPLIS